MKLALLQKFLSKLNYGCPKLLLTGTNVYLLDATRDNIKSFYIKNDIQNLQKEKNSETAGRTAIENINISACRKSFGISNVSKLIKLTT